MHTYAYSTSEKGVWVNLYGSNILDTNWRMVQYLKLTQESNYPWEGSVEIRVDNTKKNEFSMFLRIPAWAYQSSITVNGEQFRELSKREATMKSNRKWKKGDVVQLELSMESKLIQLTRISRKRKTKLL